MSADTTRAIAELLIGSLKYEFEPTKKQLAALPDKHRDWKPNPKGMGAAELAWHIAAVEVWFLDSIADGNFNYTGAGDPPATNAEIVKYYETNFPRALGRIQAMSVEALEKNIQFAVFNLPAYQYLLFANKHSVHHRGQLSTYLRALGEKVPAIYGGSADEPFQMPETKAGAAN